MKINWILPEGSKSGGIKVAMDYANFLTHAGHDVICYIPLSGQHFGWKKIFFAKEVLRTKLKSDLRGEWYNNDFKFSYPIWISNKSVRDADVTIATSWITSYWVNNMKESKGKKIYFIQGFETWGNDRINDVVKKSYSLNFDKLITVSSSLKEKLKKELGVASSVACNGVEEIFLNEYKEKTPNNITIGIPFREKSGNDIKNCEFGIEILLKIKEIHPNVNLCVFGFKKPDNWEVNISFIENPSREKLAKLYSEIDIFYVPSLYEGWGLPAMEAMGMGCCVLAANSGLIEEVGVNNYNCIIINDPRDFNEIVFKINNLIKDPEKILTIGKNAHNTISKMSIKESGKKFEEIVKQTVFL